MEDRLRKLGWTTTLERFGGFDLNLERKKIDPIWYAFEPTVGPHVAADGKRSDLVSRRIECRAPGAVSNVIPGVGTYMAQIFCR